MNGHIRGAADDALGERVAGEIGDDLAGDRFVGALRLGGEDVAVQAGDTTGSIRRTP